MCEAADCPGAARRAEAASAEGPVVCRAARLAGAGGRGDEGRDGRGGLEGGQGGEREGMGIVHLRGGWVGVDGERWLVEVRK